MRCLRAIPFVLCIASGTVASEREVVYVDSDSPGVRRVVGKIESALEHLGATSRHQVRVTFMPVADLGDAASLANMLRPVIDRHPAVIVASNGNIAAVAQSLTSEVPIVFATYGDPVATRLVRSLAQPGANVTGYTYFVPIDGKRLELLRAIAPDARRVGIIVDRWWLDELGGRAAMESFRSRQGFKATLFTAETVPELDKVLASPAARSMDAWYLPFTRIAYEEPDAVLKRLRSMRRPVAYPTTHYVEGGGLLSYQPVLDVDRASKLLATMVALILDGVPAAQIPVERPQAFELAVNVQAARNLGLRVPDAILKRANRVVMR
jgi:putative ABC transport system substrate-binding protein